MAPCSVMPAPCRRGSLSQPGSAVRISGKGWGARSVAVGHVVVAVHPHAVAAWSSMARRPLTVPSPSVSLCGGNSTAASMPNGRGSRSLNALRHDEQRVLACGREPAAPACHGTWRDQAGAVHHQHGPPAQPDVAGVAEVAQERLDQVRLVGGAVVLRQQHLVFRAVPAARPVLVGPHQAERQVDARVRQQRLQGPVQQAAAVERVHVEHEAVDAGAAGHVRLPPQHLRAVQAVEAQVARDARLVVPGEARQGAADVGPFREALAPPGVVLRDGVELRQVEGQDGGARAWHRGAGAPAPRRRGRAACCGAPRPGCRCRRRAGAGGCRACRGGGGSAAAARRPAAG